MRAKEPAAVATGSLIKKGSVCEYSLIIQLIILMSYSYP